VLFVKKTWELATHERGKKGQVVDLSCGLELRVKRGGRFFGGGR